jgi:signal transduction histidine kinase
MTQDRGAIVLNVDDNDAARYVKTRVLRMAGFEVVEAANGAAALAALQARPPELVLLDVHLPDIDGRELAARIKADPSLARIVVLQTSASHVESKHRIAALDAGADGYLVEPIEAEELVANVRALLRMRRAERERQAALEALQEADRRKDEFLAMLAHELRNPLAPIRNAVEILRLTEDRVVRERARELIGRQVVHLARLVDDLLDVSRITTGKLAVRRSVIDLQATLRDAVETVRSFVEARRHELVVDVPEEPVLVEGDRTRLSQVFSNLVNNAAKYTEPGGRIELTLRKEGEEAVVCVRDNGIGLDGASLDSIFEMFVQVDRTLERTQAGLGVGLTLARRLVTLHGGTLAVKSEGAGQGSEFEVRLPLAGAALPDDAAKERRAGDSAESRRILIADDNEDSANSLGALLAGRGHDVRVVYDGAEALRTAAEFNPEFAFLDLGMPRVQGYEVARRLREQPGNSRVVLVALTGWGREDDRQRAREAGFDRHLVKPADPVDIDAILKSH